LHACYLFSVVFSQPLAILLGILFGRQTEGEVVKVGPGRITSTGAVADMPLAPGDKVKFRDYAGTEVKIGGGDYLVMYATDVLAKW